MTFDDVAIHEVEIQDSRVCIPRDLAEAVLPGWMIDPMLRAMGAERAFDYARDGSPAFAERLGYCYVLAGQAVVTQPDGFYEHAGVPKPVALVHGTWCGPRSERRIDHAWVVLADGRVWEPITALIYDPERFYPFAEAVIEKQYTEHEARRMMIRHEHWGPWHKPIVSGNRGEDRGD